MARRVASARNVASSTRDMASSAWNMPLSARRMASGARRMTSGAWNMPLSARRMASGARRMTSSAGGVASSARIMALRRRFFLRFRSCRRINVKDILVGETLRPDRFVPAALVTHFVSNSPESGRFQGEVISTGSVRVGRDESIILDIFLASERHC